MGKINGGDNTWGFAVTGIYLIDPKAHIMWLYDNEYKGISFEESSEDAVFDVEVETLLDQTPAVSFPHIINSTI